ncbi:MAG TPA: hypothetical protein VFP49_09560 [Nitrososphaeraceae archaeon]|jgi:hypothetical protein|nr:hypothetical protein [Nitrososphaeraceae archaeon]
MFYCYHDNKFIKIIDEFILSSTNDKQLSCAIRNVDQQAAKLGISFYQMMFMLIQNDSIDNIKKKWLSKDLW